MMMIKIIQICTKQFLRRKRNEIMTIITYQARDNNERTLTFLAVKELRFVTNFVT
jgi:hypothetical protein